MVGQRRSGMRRHHGRPACPHPILDGVNRDPLAEEVVPATDVLLVEADPAALLALEGRGGAQNRSGRPQVAPQAPSLGEPLLTVGTCCRVHPVRKRNGVSVVRNNK